MFIFLIILIVIFDSSLSIDIVTCSHEELITLASEIESECKPDFSNYGFTKDFLKRWCQIHMDWKTCSKQLRSRCFDYALANDTFGIQEPYDECEDYSGLHFDYCSNEEREKIKTQYYICEEMLRRGGDIYSDIQVGKPVGELESKLAYCKLIHGNVYDKNVNCSKVFDGCGFDAYFTVSYEINDFRQREDFIKDRTSFLESVLDVDDEFCDSVSDILEFELFRFNFFKEDWPRRDNCSIKDTIPIQIQIIRECSHHNFFDQIGSSSYALPDSSEKQCDNLNKMLTCTENLMSQCYESKTILNGLEIGLIGNIITDDLNALVDGSSLPLPISTVPLFTEITETLKFFTSYNSRNFSEECPEIFSRLNFDSWFRIGDCDSKQSFEQVVDQDVTEWRTFLAKDIYDSIKGNIFYQDWFDKSNALCNYYYTALANYNKTWPCQSKQPEVTTKSSFSPWKKLFADEIEILKYFVAEESNFGETFFPYYDVKYENREHFERNSFYADGYCQSEINSLDDKLEMFDLSWPRINNCSAMDAFLLQSQIKDKCQSNVQEDLCQTISGRIECLKSLMNKCYDNKYWAVISLRELIKLSQKQEILPSEILQCEYFNDNEIFDEIPRKADFMDEIYRGDLCQQKALKIYQQFEKVKENENQKLKEDLACQYLDMFYNSKSGCWNAIYDFCYHFPGFYCDRGFNMVKGHKRLMKIKQIVPQAVQRCFKY